MARIIPKLSNLKKFLVAISLAFSLNNIDKTLIAQPGLELDTAKIDTIKYEKFHYARELLDLEKQTGFNVQPSHYQTLDSLVNEVGKDMRLGGVTEDSKRVQAFNNLENIDIILKKDNFLYRYNSDLLFHEALKTKKFNSFHFLALYLEVASKKNLPIVPMNAGEHFFAEYSLDSSNYLNWETAFGVEQSEKLYKNLIKNNKEIKNLTKDEFLSREYRDLGFSLNKDNQYKKSIECFNKAIEINSVDPIAYKYLGDSYDVLGDYNNALENYDMAINLDPSFTQAYFSRGNVFYKNNKLEKALEDYNKAIDLNPENPEFYKNRGDVYSLLYKKTDGIWDEERKPKQAQEDYEKVLELILKK